MTARFKDFGSGISTTDMDPLEFELAGKRFKCKPALQGFELMKFISETSSEDKGADSIIKLFSKVMEPKEHKRFVALLTASDVIIPISTIGDIASWLVEEYTQRPTQQQ